MNNRIGSINADGARTWPERTISGQVYTRPAHTLDIGAGAFIVYDPFPPANTAQLIDEARTLIAPKPKRTAVVHERTRDTDETASDE
jgi:hypothetical protein